MDSPFIDNGSITYAAQKVLRLDETYGHWEPCGANRNKGGCVCGFVVDRRADGVVTVAQSEELDGIGVQPQRACEVAQAIADYRNLASRLAHHVLSKVKNEHVSN